MAASTLNLAIVGKSFPIDAFQALHTASLAKRGDRAQTRSWNRSQPSQRGWRGSGQPVAQTFRIPR